MFIARTKYVQQLSKTLQRIRQVVNMNIVLGDSRGCLNMSTHRPNQSRKEYETKPFGKLIVRTGGLCDVNISRINPQEYPLQNRVLVDHMSGAEVICKQTEEIHVICNTKGMPAISSGQDKNTCHIQVPIKFDIDVHTSKDKNVSIIDLENDAISVKTESGKVVFSNIQTGTMKVDSLEGDVMCHKLLQGNIFLKTGKKGKISGDRVQAVQFVVKTQAGDINFKAVYGDESFITTETANITLKNCHRSVKVAIGVRGNLTVGNLDGNIEANLENGNIEVYALDHDHVQLNTKIGDILIKVSETVDAHLELNGKKIIVHEDLLLVGDRKTVSHDDRVIMSGNLQHINNTRGVMTDPKRVIKAQAQQGVISILCQDWLTSLNLKTGIEE